MSIARPTEGSEGIYLEDLILGEEEPKNSQEFIIPQEKLNEMKDDFLKALDEEDWGRVGSMAVYLKRLQSSNNEQNFGLNLQSEEIFLGLKSLIKESFEEAENAVDHWDEDKIVWDKYMVLAGKIYELFPHKIDELDPEIKQSFLPNIFIASSSLEDTLPRSELYFAFKILFPDEDYLENNYNRMIEKYNKLYAQSYFGSAIHIGAAIRALFPNKTSDLRLDERLEEFIEFYDQKLRYEKSSKRSITPLQYKFLNKSLITLTFDLTTLAAKKAEITDRDFEIIMPEKTFAPETPLRPTRIETN